MDIISVGPTLLDPDAFAFACTCGRAQICATKHEAKERAEGHQQNHKHYKGRDAAIMQSDA